MPLNLPLSLLENRAKFTVFNMLCRILAGKLSINTDTFDEVLTRSIRGKPKLWMSVAKWRINPNLNVSEWL